MAGGAAGAQGSNTLGAPSTGAATPGMQQPQGSGVGQLMQQPQGSGVGQLAQQGPTGGLGGMLGAIGSLGGQSNLLGQLGQATAGGQTPPNPFLGQGMPQQSPGFGPGVNNFAPPGSTGPGAMPQGSPLIYRPGVDQYQTAPSNSNFANVSNVLGALQQDMGRQAAPQTLNQASLRPLQAPDTSQDAYNRYMAQTSFTPGGAPTYDQFVQQRNQSFQQAQQFEQMSPQQQLAHMQAMNDQKMQAAQAAGMPQSLGGFGAMPPSLGQQILNGQMPQGMPQRGFPPQGMPQRGFPGPRPMPLPQQGGAGARTPLQGLGGLQQLMAKNQQYK